MKKNKNPSKAFKGWVIKWNISNIIYNNCQLDDINGAIGNREKENTRNNTCPCIVIKFILMNNYKANTAFDSYKV